MSAYFASPPVIARTTTPRITNAPIWGNEARNRIAYIGLSARKTSGLRMIQGSPLIAIQGNQTSIMNQPNRPPT